MYLNMLCYQLIRMMPVSMQVGFIFRKASGYTATGWPKNG